MRGFLPIQVAAILALGVASLNGLRADPPAEDIIPSAIGEKEKSTLQRFLNDLKKEPPRTFKPVAPEENFIGFPEAEFDWETSKDAPVHDYLTAVIPERVAEPDDPITAVDVYWFRPNPKLGKPGVTIKRKVDLTKGKQIGDLEVFFNYPTPLSREEYFQAVSLAQKSPSLKEFNSRVKEPMNVEITWLVRHVRAKGASTLEPGDRVVDLEFQDKTSHEAAAVVVDLTKFAVTERNSKP